MIKPRTLHARWNRDGSITLYRRGRKIFRTTRKNPISPPAEQAYAFTDGYSGDGRRAVTLKFIN